MSDEMNVLFVTLDQWRADCVGAFGHPVVKTPNIDAVARRGVGFRRHYTNAVPCSPARACLYTGLHQQTNRVVRNGTPLDRRHLTIAQAVRRAGYDPTLFGYTDTGADPRDYAANDPWLKTYEGVLPGMTPRVRLPEDLHSWGSWLKARGHAVPRRLTDLWLPRTGPSDTPGAAPPIWSADETQAAYLVDEAIRWHSEQRGPWFCHLSLLSPHPPWIAPEPWHSMYDPLDGPDFIRPADWREVERSHPFAAYAFRNMQRHKFVYGARGATMDWSEAEQRRIRAIYWGLITEADAQLGRLLAAIDAAGQTQDTLVILTADHAEQLGDHHYWGKLGYYDQSYAIPLIVADPRRPEAHNTTVNAFTEAVDVMPTILDLMGLDVPDHLDGKPLTLFLEGTPPAKWRDAAHWSFDFRDVSDNWPQEMFERPMEELSLHVIRDERFKYVHFPSMPPLLFDLASDPGEHVNVADDPAYRLARLEMAERMLSWRETHLDKTMTATELTHAGAVTAKRT
ncbi:MAG: alkaline phosphatase family protein [Hyphomicrobiaceae bacterium]|nr:alkaline phosphatase family protein [Hyphomicrobiaceae bacterium]